MIEFYSFSLAGPAEISNIPGLSDILRRIIAKKITKKMVAPNRVSKKLCKTIPPSLIKMNEPEVSKLAKQSNMRSKSIGF